MSLKAEVGNKGKALPPKPFALENAGHYDFTALQQLDRVNWRFFALALFECKDKKHKVGSVMCDGTRGGFDVLVFDHHQNPDAFIDEDWITDLHARLGAKAGARFYIVAQRQSFDFQTDYLEVGDTRFYALRIPYSFIEELHKTRFAALRQHRAQEDLNALQEAVGFDFIEVPEVDFKTGIEQPIGKLIPDAYLEITDFQSKTKTRNGTPLEGFEALSMLLLDLDYNGKTFDYDRAFYPAQLKTVIKNDDGTTQTLWRATWALHETGERVSAIWIDIHGNESIRVLNRTDFEGEIS